MYHIFLKKEESITYAGLTSCDLAGTNEILLPESEFNPDTQIGVLVKGKIEARHGPNKEKERADFLQKERLKAIDAETEKEISDGFVFDGHRFSLSQRAQINWQGLLLLHQAALFEDQEISTKEEGSYLLVTSKLIEFIKAGSVVIKNTLKTGRDKKKQL